MWVIDIYSKDWWLEYQWSEPLENSCGFYDNGNKIEMKAKSLFCFNNTSILHVCAPQAFLLYSIVQTIVSRFYGELIIRRNNLGGQGMALG